MRIHFTHSSTNCSVIKLGHQKLLLPSPPPLLPHAVGGVPRMQKQSPLCWDSGAVSVSMSGCSAPHLLPIWHTHTKNKWKSLWRLADVRVEERWEDRVSGRRGGGKRRRRKKEKGEDGGDSEKRRVLNLALNTFSSCSPNDLCKVIPECLGLRVLKDLAPDHFLLVF